MSSVCEATYSSGPPYKRVQVTFHQTCKHDANLLTSLRGLSAVDRVTAQSSQRLQIDLKSDWQTADGSKKAVEAIGETVYNKGCAHK